MKTKPYGWVRMNPTFNSGVFHLGTECPPGWVGGAVAVHSEQPAREWVGLTAQELAAMAENVYGSAHHDDITFGVEIQAKLKERNA